MARPVVRAVALLAAVVLPRALAEAEPMDVPTALVLPVLGASLGASFFGGQELGTDPPALVTLLDLCAPGGCSYDKDQQGIQSSRNT